MGRILGTEVLSPSRKHQDSALNHTITAALQILPYQLLALLAFELFKLSSYKPRIICFTADFSAKFRNIVIICVILLTGENYVIKNVIIRALRHIHNQDNEIKKNEMDRAYNTLRKEVYTKFWSEN
jgi:hypothetical protein